MEQVPPADQGALARDVFSLAHFSMLWGIVCVAVAIEEAMLHPADPLPGAVRLTLAVGLALFLGGSSLARWRAEGSVPIALALVTAAILALVPSVSWTALGVSVAGTAAIVLLEEVSAAPEAKAAT